ncbi:MAG: TrkH family potassium uptake protein, partial [Bacteroidia bacterium]|nr:TrkH family potassium uptake protein [Bacteroidia bacterium]
MRLNFKIILHFLGLLLCFNGGFMLAASLMSYVYNDGQAVNISLAGVAVIAAGLVLMINTRRHNKEMNKREGYVVVTFGWLIMALSGTLPYIFTDTIPSFTNAFFETISGYTTTGATILNDIEVLPEGILFWRSLTHWIGGMGIIVLAVAILPLLGIGGMQLFAAEAPGPSADKLHPRITDTAKRLWLIYVGYTAAETVLLNLAGMSFFDAINHSMCTVSTGGFSTKNASLAHWNANPLIQYIVMLFMFLAGMNFVLSYFIFKGRILRIIRDEEFKLYWRFIFVFTVIAALII